MAGAIIVQPTGYFSIQMGPGHGLEVSVFALSFNGTYAYKVSRIIAGKGDPLGTWTQESDKSHAFGAFNVAHSYNFAFTWAHAIAHKDPKPEETENVEGAEVLFTYNSFEFVRFKLKRV